MVQVNVVVANSVTQLPASVAGQVLVAGSHGGLIAGHLAVQSGARAIILNDAGIGKDQAGIASLQKLAQIGMAAATVARTTADMGDGSAVLCGRISHVNPIAHLCGVRAGQPAQQAAHLLKRAPLPYRKTLTLSDSTTAESGALEGRHELAASNLVLRVIGCDSVSLVEPQDQGQILVIGSHSALHAGPESALSVNAYAAFFHDAGYMQSRTDRSSDSHIDNTTGISRLPVLDARGIPAATVDHRSARIGDARSMYLTGILSHLNEAARALGWMPGMPVQWAIFQTLKNIQPPTFSNICT